MTMYSKIIQSKLTYGQAIDAMIHEGKKITRSVWRGYWVYEKNLQTAQVTEDGYVHERNLTGIIIACLRDNGGYVPASPYLEDITATDWMIVE